MITEEMLYAASAEADQVIRDSLPALEECRHEFSQTFQKKMHRTFRRAKHPVLYKLAHSAACFVLAVILIGGTWLTVDAQARDALIRWIKDTYTFTSYTVYHFEGTDSKEQSSEGQASQEQTSAAYSLARVPDGYTQWRTDNVGDGIFVTYTDESGNLLKFGYLPSSSAAYMFVETSNSTQQSTYVGEVPADFYLSHSPDQSNSIVWTSSDGETAFFLSGFFSKEELIEMAEQVLPYDGESIKNYTPKWLPEGYEETQQTILPVLKNVIYTNADDQMISFSCTYGDQGGDTVFIDDYRSVSAVQVGNVQADFYLASQEGEGNALVWPEETDGVLFCIISPLPEDVLIRIAESVEVVD